MSSTLLAALDHSLLAPTTTEAELEDGAHDALRLGVAAYCMLPYFVPRARALLRSSRVKTCTVVGFPHGAMSPRAKRRECETALEDGAEEIDAVINVSAVLSEHWSRVDDEIGNLTRACHQAGAKIKWIFETCYLTDAQIVRLCSMCASHEVDWVKTSTGFGSGGATAAHVRLMKESSPPTMQVKASGGIRTLEEARHYLELGASRIGTSRTLAIAEQLRTPS